MKRRPTRSRRISSASLQGLELLEGRRLLSVNSDQLDNDQVDQTLWPQHPSAGCGCPNCSGIPLDTSDWSRSEFEGRFGGLEASDIFNLQSKPDSNFTLYLDFDGHVTTGTIWNTNYGIDTIVSPPFDLDGDSTTFGQSELERILISWQRTAEDFAPFDINVTTREPSLDQLTNTGGGDQTWGVRAVATFDTFANCGCGGHAFLNTFEDSVDTPTFVYNLGEGSLGETFSHEVGHMLGLVHDGDSGQEYYPGHGSGATQWGSIMGAPFDENVTQWDQGEYFDANNGEDDLSQITIQNGFGYRNDDFGNTFGSASALQVSSGNSLHTYGIIERNTDLDFFSFETGAGDVSLNIDPLGTRPNLDIFAALYDSGGNLVTFSNPADQLNAVLNANVAAGTYFVRVEGVGSDDIYNAGTDTVEEPGIKPWQSSNPTGYSDYGSLGQYTVSGSFVAPGANSFSIAATDAVKSEGISGQQAFTFTVTRQGNTGVAASVDYTLQDSLPENVGDTTPNPTDAADFAGGTLFSDTLNFAANETSKTITLNVVGDTDFELDEYFDMTLSDPSAGWVLADSQATGIILSDETEISFPSTGKMVDVNEGPFNGALVRWRQIGAAGTGFDEWAIDNVSLQNSTLVDDFDPITNANWSEISNGSVTNQFGGSGNALTMNDAADRRIVTRFLNASPGDLLTFDIIFGDSTNGGENADPGEDVVLEFSLDGGSNWDAFAVFDTEDYTTWTTVQAALPSGIDTNPNPQLTFNIEREGGVSEAATVDWEVDTVGVANPVDADDFLGGVLPSGQANFPAGESTTQVVITVNPDFSFEADEEFRLTLTGAGGNGTVVVSDENDAFGMIINDDAAFSVNPGPQFRLRQQDSSGSDFDNWGIDNVNYTGGLVSDDFDPDIDLTQWGSVELGETNSNFGGTGNSLFFTGSGQRAITTNPLNAVAGDVLSFDFIYGDDNNGGENPEDGEEVVLEYSLDTGQSWTFMNQYDLNVITWTTMNEPVPAGAIRDPEAADEGISISFDVVRFGVDTNAVESMVPWEVVGSGSDPADAADFPGGLLPSGVLHFAAGEITKSITIDVLDDGLFEADETFDLVVGGIGSGFLATGTILNNDSMPNGDFDGDGDYDCDDIDGLVENIVNQTNVATYDMDGNAMLDTADLDEWLAVAGNVNLPSGNPYLVGDANLDGIVDGQDFLAWNDSKFTSGNGWCGGDFNADGITDGQDYLLWNNNKFTSSATLAPLAPATPSLPEQAAQRLVVSPPVMAPVAAPLHAGILYQAAPPALRVYQTDAAFADLEADQDESSEQDRWEDPWAALR